MELSSKCYFLFLNTTITVIDLLDPSALITKQNLYVRVCFHWALNRTWRYFKKYKNKNNKKCQWRTFFLNNKKKSFQNYFQDWSQKSPFSFFQISAKFKLSPWTDQRVYSDLGTYKESLPQECVLIWARRLTDPWVLNQSFTVFIWLNSENLVAAS